MWSIEDFKKARKTRKTTLLWRKLKKNSWIRSKRKYACLKDLIDRRGSHTPLLLLSQGEHRE
jgi:hypothetical protein